MRTSTSRDSRPSVNPVHCRKPMADVTTLFDVFERGGWRFECVVCGQQRYVSEDESPPPVPAAPTCHPVGSEGKLAALMERARRREQLFHPDDSKEREKVSAKSEARKNARAPRTDLPHGVNWDRRLRKYRARATVGGERRHLGLFASKGEAAAAVAAALAGTEPEITGAVVSDAG